MLVRSAIRRRWKGGPRPCRHITACWPTDYSTTDATADAAGRECCECCRCDDLGFRAVPAWDAGAAGQHGAGRHDRRRRGRRACRLHPAGARLDRRQQQVRRMHAQFMLRRRASLHSGHRSSRARSQLNPTISTIPKQRRPIGHETAHSRRENSCTISIIHCIPVLGHTQHAPRLPPPTVTDANGYALSARTHRANSFQRRHRPSSYQGPDAHHAYQEIPGLKRGDVPSDLYTSHQLSPQLQQPVNANVYSSMQQPKQNDNLFRSRPRSSASQRQPVPVPKPQRDDTMEARLLNCSCTQW